MSSFRPHQRTHSSPICQEGRETRSGPPPAWHHPASFLVRASASVLDCHAKPAASSSSCMEPPCNVDDPWFSVRLVPVKNASIPRTLVRLTLIPIVCEDAWLCVPTTRLPRDQLSCGLTAPLRSPLMQLQKSLSLWTQRRDRLHIRPSETRAPTQQSGHHSAYWQQPPSLAVPLRRNRSPPQTVAPKLRLEARFALYSFSLHISISSPTQRALGSELALGRTRTQTPWVPPTRFQTACCHDQVPYLNRDQAPPPSFNDRMIFILHIYYPISVSRINSRQIAPTPPTTQHFSTATHDQNCRDSKPMPHPRSKQNYPHTPDQRPGSQQPPDAQLSAGP
ncbi:Hypothetical_protein [Hexamita inflata]|uniref:Hypothetical_protein n=1 Tax=Hexamita inflata TaxID=28002 RepID=A0AA86RXA1_9EUKA|nr:Hypothetical protein HINF_LOCUS61915 [Hexamita inflata]